MTDKKQTTNWSDERYREMLVYQRKFMWSDDALERLAAWLNLRPRMTVADIGCGLGFLGYAWWPYYGAGGHYIGIDSSMDLLHDAQQGARNWAGGGEASFVRGDAYHLPLADNSVDGAMCQAVLMHLVEPQKALAEMVRVLKPGGLAVCFEPDNLSSMMVKRHWSLPEPTVEDLLLECKVALLTNRGKIKLGMGDNNIGVRIVHMMTELGLTEVDARLNDRVWFLEPPYEGPLQQHRLAIAKMNMLDDAHREFWDNKGKEEFVAGGGDPEEYERYLEYGQRLRPEIERQFEEGCFYGCGSNDMYVVKGRKRR